MIEKISSAAKSLQRATDPLEALRREFLYIRPHRLPEQFGDMVPDDLESLTENLNDY